MTLPAIGLAQTSPSTTGAANVPARQQFVGAARELRPLRVELVQADLTRARHRLVRRHDHAVDARGAVQRRERGDRDHRRAVRARRDALRQVRRSSGFTSATTSGTSGSMRNAAELSTTRAPAAAARGAHSSARSVVDVDDHEIEAVEAAVAQHLARDLAAAERQLAAFRSRRRVRAQLVDREVALLEDAQHLGADHAGRTHEADADIAPVR